MKEHEFTQVIRQLLTTEFDTIDNDVFSQSDLIQYLNEKTDSLSRGSKARSNFGSIYAIYVLVEDYVQRGFHTSGDYKDAEGVKFTELLKRQRELPFGEKLQNHALNHRLNLEFQKLFPLAKIQPIIRDPETLLYSINEHLLIVKINGIVYNIALTILNVINAYIKAKQESFYLFIQDCERIKQALDEPGLASEFVSELLRPNVDARIFEIVSFAILKAHYGDMSIYWGWELGEIAEEKLVLFKTGRTNANDGGIDFVMRPLGRFFQVTETIDVKKYFLDIDKVQKYPITFVVKTELGETEIVESIQKQAFEQYPLRSIVKQYMASIEEVINVPILLERLQEVIDNNDIHKVMDEIIKHSRVEFNIEV